jgi:hypothetical protein
VRAGDIEPLEIVDVDAVGVGEIDEVVSARGGGQRPDLIMPIRQRDEAGVVAIVAPRLPVGAP